MEQTESQLRIKAMEFALRNKPESYTEYNAGGFGNSTPRTITPKYNLIEEAEKIYQYLNEGITQPEA